MNPESDVNPESLPLSVQERIEGVCARFERNWQAGQTPRLEDYLEGVADSERGPLLRELLRVEIHYRALRGESPAAGEYLPRFPGREDLIRDLLSPTPTPTGVGGATGPDLGAGLDAQRHGAPGTLPAAFADRVPGYEILGELGRGGMGVVYRARQRQLNRLVSSARKPAPNSGSVTSQCHSPESPEFPQKPL